MPAQERKRPVRTRPLNVKTVLMDALERRGVELGPRWDAVPDLVLYDGADSGYQPPAEDMVGSEALSKVFDFTRAVHDAVDTDRPPRRARRRER